MCRCGLIPSERILRHLGDIFIAVDKLVTNSGYPSPNHLMSDTSNSCENASRLEENCKSKDDPGSRMNNPDLSRNQSTKTPSLSSLTNLESVSEISEKSGEQRKKHGQSERKKGEECKQSNQWKDHKQQDQRKQPEQCPVVRRKPSSVSVNSPGEVRRENSNWSADPRMSVSNQQSPPPNSRIERIARSTASYNKLKEKEEPKKPIPSTRIRQVDPNNPPHYMRDTEASKKMSESKQVEMKKTQSRKIDKDKPPHFAKETEVSRMRREALEEDRKKKEEEKRQKEEEKKKREEKEKEWNKRYEDANRSRK